MQIINLFLTTLKPIYFALTCLFLLVLNYFSQQIDVTKVIGFFKLNHKKQEAIQLNKKARNKNSCDYKNKFLMPQASMGNQCMGGNRKTNQQSGENKKGKTSVTGKRTQNVSKTKEEKSKAQPRVTNKMNNKAKLNATNNTDKSSNHSIKSNSAKSYLSDINDKSNKIDSPRSKNEVLKFETDTRSNLNNSQYENEYAKNQNEGENSIRKKADENNSKSYNLNLIQKENINKEDKTLNKKKHVDIAKPNQNEDTASKSENSKVNVNQHESLHESTKQTQKEKQVNEPIAKINTKNTESEVKLKKPEDWETMKVFHLINLDNESEDTNEYRNGYPGLKDNKRIKSNLEFFTGEMKSFPRGDFIHNIHKNWWGDYEKLEIHHGYIQWLFPLRVPGVNVEADPLQLHELKTLMNEENKEKTQKTLLKSYKMMLDFYGMELNNEFGVERSGNFKERYANLMKKSHNFLRITRILKCLGDFEMEKYQIGFVEFLIHEIFVTGKLFPLANSLTRFWIHTIKNDKIRFDLIELIKNLIETI